MTDSTSTGPGSVTREPDDVDDLGEERRRQLLDAAAHFHSAACQLIGRPVDLDSGQELQKVLFEELGLPPTPGYTTDTSALYALRDEHPHLFVTYLLAYRAVSAATIG
ncbi:hypothetical protein [Nocardia vaccinii]|uniref:hypothetical protein n=1 Tax=Nocardia vaccinii TaxID=1822 RepID=UPI0012F4BD97|nr:hypothetical protein [Nocardia vaccinii]